MSEASKIIEYIGERIIAHVGTILDLSDSAKLVYLNNIDEASDNVDFSFILKDENMPYVQMVAPSAQSILKTQNLEQLQLEVSICVFFRIPNTILPRSLEAQQYKQDVAFELRQIADDIERNQKTNALAPDLWMSQPATISLEKSTLYSEPGDQYPPYMATIKMSINFDEEYQ